MRILFYCEIGIIVLSIGYITYSQFSWLPPTITVVFTVLGWVIFGERERFKEWIQNQHQKMNKNFINSQIKLILVNISLLFVIAMVVKVDSRLILKRELNIDKAAYAKAAADINSDNVEVRLSSAMTINQIFLRYKKTLDILPGLIKICEDPDPRVQDYSKEPLKSFHSRSEILVLEFEDLIFIRLRALRRMYCKTSLCQKTSFKELTELAHRTYNLLSVFEAISKFIKTDQYKHKQSNTCHEIIYQSLDILALLICAVNDHPKDVSLEESIKLSIFAEKIKKLLHTEPFKGSCEFITVPDNQKRYFTISESDSEFVIVEDFGQDSVFYTVLLPKPTWYYLIKFRISQFIDKEKVDQIFRQVLAEPLF
jgi:hypothetical protein